jgi:DNA-binding XRE family transcriptional regulator
VYASVKEWKIRNKEYVREYQRQYRILTKEHRLAYKSAYTAEKRKVDPQINLRHNICRKLRRSIFERRLAGVIEDIGCTSTELIKYIESKWQEGMSWENYGKTGWHLDHIKPLGAFDLTDKAQFQEASYYTNIQPLWAWENALKGKRYDSAKG